MGPIPRISEALEPFVSCEWSLGLSRFETANRYGNCRSTGTCVTLSVARRHVVLLSDAISSARFCDDLVEVFPIVGGERMVRRLLGEAFTRRFV